MAPGFRASKVRDHLSRGIAEKKAMCGTHLKSDGETLAIE